MMHFFKPEADQLLYHYTTAEGAAAILRSRALRLSEFSMMNDSSEYHYAKSKFVEAYQNREVWIEEMPRWIANISLNTHEPSTVMMIGCLTEDQDDVGLWERYTSSGRGCVLGLDENWLVKCAGVAIKRVSYDPNYLRCFVESSLVMLQSHYEENPEDRDDLKQLARMLVLDLYSFKDPRSISEREVRISHLTLTDDTEEFALVDPGGQSIDGHALPALPIQQRQGAYGPTRFVDLPLWDDEKPVIKSLAFGPKIDVESEALITSAAREHSQISLWRSDVPLR